MVEQYFGTKELYQVCLKANTTMRFGNRLVEEGEPLIYFDHVSLAALNETSRPIMARGGWGNMPRVIWEDRSEMTFSLNEGVITPVGMGLLFSAEMMEKKGEDRVLVPYREFFEPNGKVGYTLQHKPDPKSKIFCFAYDRNAIQHRIDDFEIKGRKIFVKNEDLTQNYMVDYYFEYGETSLLYVIEQERFRGTFTLEGKFYTKDENDGKNVTNILTMPKARLISNINLRLGERADPTTSVFNIIATPVKTQESDKLLVKVLRLDSDIDSDD